jgi:glyoxylase-like metal-dependent hydrolase (beta-lactamase superfamily II)
MPLLMDDEHRYRRSLREIKHFVERTPGLLVVPGHDRDAWPELDAVYG